MKIKRKEIQDVLARMSSCLSVQGIDADRDNKWAYALSKNFRILNQEYVNVMKYVNTIPDDCKDYVTAYSALMSNFSEAHPESNGLKNITPELKATIDIAVKELNAKMDEDYRRFVNHQENIDKHYLEEEVEVEIHKIPNNLIPVLSPQQIMSIEFMIDETRKSLMI